MFYDPYTTETVRHRKKPLRERNEDQRYRKDPDNYPDERGPLKHV